MLYLPISRSWMVSRSAQRVYLACAIANLYLLAVWVGTRTAMVESGVGGLAAFPATGRLVQILLWPGIVGTALLLVAMWYFWFTFDQSHWLKKALWFVILCMGFTLGPFLYYLLAYRRSGTLEGRA